MTIISLEAANTIVDKAIDKAHDMAFPPMTVVVLDAGGHLKAAKREDNSGILREDIARGKAWGVLGMGFGGREFQRRAKNNPMFIQALMDVSGGRIVPVAGSVLIRGQDGELLGSVGISGGNSDEDDICAIHGVKSVGLVSDNGDPN